MTKSIGGKVAGKKVLGSYKKGGKVKKTGTYKLHKGEIVMPKKMMMKGNKMKGRKKTGYLAHSL